MSLHIFGSHGDFTINDDGTFAGEAPEGYPGIQKFDVTEYREWAKKIGDESDSVDILNIGYWYESKEGENKYEPPDEGYRKHVEEGWPQPIITNEGLAGALGVD